MIFKNIGALLSMAALAGAGYVFLSPPGTLTMPSFSAAKEPTSYSVLKLANSRDLHDVKVVRLDTDGFVVSCFEGTFKLWNYQLTPDAYGKLKRVSPEPTPTPVHKSLFDQTPTPTQKTKERDAGLNTFKNWMN
ncbi:MAG: hypothetical protein ACFUZC_13470 [Chthoniobacteraceae bacterium]